jgi:cholinesterase
MKKAFVRLYALLVSMLTFCLPTTAFAEPFSELIIFSGTLSDVGNFASVHGDFPPPFFNNRTTNGPNLEDVLAANLGFPNDPSLHLIGPPVGNNFAVFQALAGGHGPEDLPEQVNAYLTSRGGAADPNALFFIFIGGTEVINAVATPDDRVSSQIVTDSVNGIENAIRTLVHAGAERLLVPNFADLGTTPFARKLGTPRRATRISLEFDKKFQAMLNRVERQLDFELIRWNFLEFAYDVLSHADELGFTNTTDSCLDLLPAGKCDFDRFFFFTDLFLTSKVHKLMGNAVTAAIYERDRARCWRDNQGKSCEERDRRERDDR